MPGLRDLHGESTDEVRLAHTMADRPYNVLFLCTGSSARSILAAKRWAWWGSRMRT